LYTAKLGVPADRGKGKERDMTSFYRQVASSWRAAIGSAFYANSVRQTTMAELYGLALKQPEVISSTESMYDPERFELPKDAKILVSNDGAVVGRTALARRLVRQLDKAEREKLKTVLLDAIYQFNRRHGLWLEGIV
jgi:phosphoenolpyruvate carboxykinase (ATP)